MVEGFLRLDRQMFCSSSLEGERKRYSDLHQRLECSRPGTQVQSSNGGMFDKRIDWEDLFSPFLRILLLLMCRVVETFDIIRPIGLMQNEKIRQILQLSCKKTGHGSNKGICEWE